MKNNWLFNNIGLKILAIFLAFMTWLYIASELTRGTMGEKTALMQIYPYKVSAKKIPIRLNIVGNVPAGFEVENDKIELNPNTCILIGPKQVIEDIKEVTTETVNVSEYTRTFKKELSLLPIGKNIILEGQFTELTLPIRKAPEKLEKSIEPAVNFPQ